MPDGEAFHVAGQTFVRALWATAFFAIVFPIVAMAATLAPDNSPPDCHVYYSDNKYVGVQKVFGRFFRDGYEFGKICGAVRGETSYFVGHLPVKNSTSVCRYTQVELMRDHRGRWIRIYDELMQDKTGKWFRFHQWHEYDDEYAWYGKTECPPVNLDRYAGAYLRADGVSDEYVGVLWKFWDRLKSKGLNAQETFSKVPIDYWTRAFLDDAAAGLTEGNFKLEALHASYDCDGVVDWRNEKKIRVYGMSIVNEWEGWTICGKIVDQTFSPNVIGAILY
tara:strand:- start:17908 stop:18741 length:834 start_codon:yes stop_codon:yes gene_type:complete